MSKSISQSCPLCSSGAEYCHVDADNRKYFNCPQCSYFQISLRAEQLLVEKSDDYRAILSKKSHQAPKGYLLTILMPNVNDWARNPSISIKAEYVLKSGLPLR